MLQLHVVTLCGFGNSSKCLKLRHSFLFNSANQNNQRFQTLKQNPFWAIFVHHSIAHCFPKLKFNYLITGVTVIHSIPFGHSLLHPLFPLPIRPNEKSTQCMLMMMMAHNIINRKSITFIRLPLAFGHLRIFDWPMSHECVLS